MVAPLIDLRRRSRCVCVCLCTRVCMCVKVRCPFDVACVLLASIRRSTPDANSYLCCWVGLGLHRWFIRFRDCSFVILSVLLLPFFVRFVGFWFRPGNFPLIFFRALVRSFVRSLHPQAITCCGASTFRDDDNGVTNSVIAPSLSCQTGTYTHTQAQQQRRPIGFERVHRLLVVL